MNILATQKIDDRFFLIAEEVGNAMVGMALVIGDEKAALIDAGFGITGNLRQYVEEITTKPIIHLITHCDPDHAGGSAQFDDRYMSSMDEELQPTSLCFEKRVKDLSFVSGGNPLVEKFLRENMTPDESFTYKNIHDGDTYDLGGRTLEAFALPGHTKGSMCFIDRKGGCTLTGDSIAIRGAATVSDKRCPPLTVFRDALKRFIDQSSGLTLYTGHSFDPLENGFAERLLRLCDEIIAGDTAGDTPFVSPFGASAPGERAMVHQGGNAGIRYNPKNI